MIEKTPNKIFNNLVINPSEKNWMIALHASPLASYLIPGAGLIAPVVIWLAKRDQSAVLDIQGKEVVNFVITIFLAMLISTLLLFIFIGIPLMIAVAIFNLIFSITGIVKAANGEMYRYPYIIRPIK